MESDELLYILLLFAVLIIGFILLCIIPLAVSDNGGLKCDIHNNLIFSNDYCVEDFNETEFEVGCSALEGNFSYKGKVKDKDIYNCVTEDEIVIIVYDNESKLVSFN